LAAALLAGGSADGAAGALDLALRFKVDLATKATPADRVPVPAKLIISLSRNKAEQPDAAAVRKAVTVETVGFPPADPEK
jgi:hypothetical protein